MAKQIYIDENGNEHLVSGTINTAQMLPIDATDNTNTKDYINSGLSGKQNSFTFITLTTSDFTWDSGNFRYVSNNTLTTILNGKTFIMMNGYFTNGGAMFSTRVTSDYINVLGWIPASKEIINNNYQFTLTILAL